MLAWACDANPDGVVLFSSRDPHHIRQNVVLGPSPERSERAERLAALLRAPA
jgi:hypothetical protein